MTAQDTPGITRPKDAEPASGPARKPVPDSPNPQPPDDDGLDFVVTEANSQDPEMVGGFKSSPVDPLAVESTADLMQAAARPGKTEGNTTARASLFAESYVPTPAPPTEEDFGDLNTARIGINGSNEPPAQPESTVEKLSEQRIKEISQRMKMESARSDYLSEEETRQILSRMNGDDLATRTGTGFDTRPIIPPKRNKEAAAPPADFELPTEKPKIAKRVRGIAYFAKGYIHISGEQELREGDEMSICGREYVLRRKRVSNKMIASVVTPIAAILVFILGTQLSPDAQIGDGRIVGFALDQSNQPYVSGAAVRLPETGATFEINGQGFFRSDQLPAGSYKIEYVVDNHILATDYATVSDNNITTIVLRPEVAQAAAPPVPAAGQSDPASSSLVQPKPAAPTVSSRPQPAAPTSGTTRTAKGDARSTEAKLTLNANVDGARLSLDGSVVGAGNLTYTRLKPGKHSYTVSKDGYKSVSGTIDLRADNTSTLDVTLQSLSATPKAERSLDKELYSSGVAALEKGDAQTAIADLTRALEATPNYADAYSKRAEAYRLIQDKPSAYDDYLRAAGVYQSRNDYDKAAIAYQEALKLNPKGTGAYLGRGSLYLAKNEAIAAAADFDQVVTLDKRNVEGYIGLGRARYNQGHFDKAVKHFRDARSLDSDNPVIHQYLMLSHFGAGEFDEVRKDYDKFQKCATAEQIRQLKADSRFVPVLRILE
jgi:tetratricopeptide (TPR) repeat protein